MSRFCRIMLFIIIALTVTTGSIKAGDEQPEPYVSAYGVKITVYNLYDIKDLFIAKGEFTTYREMKNNGYIVSATASKVRSDNSYTYTVSEPGIHTVLVRYNDGSIKIMYEELTVDEPEFTVNGLQVNISNIPDVRMIRTAYGTHKTVKEVKAANGFRNFSSKTAIGNKTEYTIQYREEGAITVTVEYNNGYLKVFNGEIIKKSPSVEYLDRGIRFSDLDGLVMIRYAKGIYSSSSEIKRAPGSMVLKSNTIKDGYITVSGLDLGVYTFCAQYDDESFNLYTLTVAAPDDPLALDEYRIAYSYIGLCPQNTEEHFISVAQMGFNVLKCDVRPTKDGELICCHDDGFTLTESDPSVIETTFDNNNRVLISDMTAEECLALKHRWRRYNNGMGHAAHPCTLEDFLQVCIEYDKIPLITIRNENTDVVLSRLLELVDKYDLRYKCIVNSLSYKTLQALRERDENIALSYVISSTKIPDKSDVDAVADLGRCILTGFNYNNSAGVPELTGIKPVVEYAKTKDVKLLQAIMYSRLQWDSVRSLGFHGGHVATSIFDYEPFSREFSISIENGAATFHTDTGLIGTATVKNGITRIKNIKFLSSTRDFADAVMPIWLNYLPNSIICSDNLGNTVNSGWDSTNGCIVLDTAEDGFYKINVTIG